MHQDFLDNTSPNTYLRCYSENNVSVFHPNLEFNCLLDFKNTTFPVCNNMQLLPEEPTINDHVKIIITTCYQIPLNGGTAPEFSGINVVNYDQGSEINLYYIDYNDYSGENIMIPYPLNDTVTLGQFNMGIYKVHCMVNTIHQTGIIDTVFKDKEFVTSFYMTGIRNKTDYKIRKTNDKCISCSNA